MFLGWDIVLKFPTEISWEQKDLGISSMNLTNLHFIQVCIVIASLYIEIGLSSLESSIQTWWVKHFVHWIIVEFSEREIILTNNKVKITVNIISKVMTMSVVK